MFVTEEGAVKLLDFGIAKSLDNRIGGAATRTGLTPMTPEYASPEQLAGKPLTTACDIYALGLLLYELLSGSLANASKGSSFAELAQRIATQSPTRPSHRVDAGALEIETRVADDWRRRIAGDLDRVVLKALAAEPQRRYESARVFADDLTRWLENRPVLARGGGVWYRLGKFAQRNRLAVAASTAAVCALAVGIAFAAVQARRAAAEGERALRANRFLTDMIGRADPHFGGKPPTLVDALDRAVIDIPQQLAGQPLLEADIRRAIGHAYLMLERSEAAKVQLDRAADLRAAVGGTDYAKVLDSQGVLEWQLGRHQEAQRLFQRGLENTGDDDRGLAQRAELLNDYSSLLSEIGRYDEALVKAEQAQRLKDALPDILPRERAIGLSNIATAQDGLGRVDAAYATYLRSLRQLEAIDPPPESTTAPRRSSAGDARRRRQCWNPRERVQSTSDPQTRFAIAPAIAMRHPPTLIGWASAHRDLPMCGTSAGIDGSRIDEAQRILPFVFRVERALAPWPDADAATGHAVHHLARQTSERLRAGEDRVEIVDREVQRLRRRMRFAGRGYIDHLQRHRAAGEVDTRAGLFSAGNTEQRAVEIRCLVEVADLDVDAEQIRHISAGAFAGFLCGRLLRSRFLRCFSDRLLRCFLHRRHEFLPCYRQCGSFENHASQSCTNARRARSMR